MAFNAEAREARQFDKTYLSESGNGRSVHRDYGAHYFRWGFAYRFCAQKTVLDVGCGPEWPLGRVLRHHGRPPLRPKFYVGVDMNKLKESGSEFMEFYGEFDFTTRYKELLDKHGDFDVVTNFEVLEHMGGPDQLKLLTAMGDCVKPDGIILLSTPVRAESGHQARNHIREVTVAELKAMIDEAGLEVVKRYGTYGDVKSMAADYSPAEKEVVDRLAAYYSNDVLSNFLAPLHPDKCKNNLWVLKRSV